MNKQCYRIIFNKRRGQLMAVGECASSAGKAARGERPSVVTDHATGSPKHGLGTSPLRQSIVAWVFAVGGLAPLSWSQAQVIADPNAPTSQRPTVLNAPNGVPLVNIQTPTAAGVSRNTYGQFDVQSQGIILNNSRTNIQTQQGGWVQGNPWLATGSARVILNEVNSAHPSQLKGYVEVAGQKAEVIIANPSGIQVNGAGFINTSRAVLTTGTPQLSGGSISSYSVARGTVSVNGKGLDASLTDYTGILARAIEVNAGIWAKEIKAIAGSNVISADLASIQAAPAAAQGAVPAFALDVAQLGGMYADKIFLVGTEVGVGVRNAGSLSSRGALQLSADGKLTNSGSITARQLDVTANDLDNRGGTLAQSGSQQLDIILGQLGNGSGQIGYDAMAAAPAAAPTPAPAPAPPAAPAPSPAPAPTGEGSGTTDLPSPAPLPPGSIRISGQTQNDAGRITALGPIHLSASQGVSNAGRIDVSSLHIQGPDLTNSHILQANTADIQVDQFNNSGSFQTTGSSHIHALQALHNTGHLLSSGSLAIRAGELNNLSGQIVQTGSLDLSIEATGHLDNTQGRIAANSENLHISAASINNSSGTLEHAGSGSLTLRSGQLDSPSSHILSNGTLDIQATDILHAQSSASAKQIVIQGQSLNNQHGVISQSGNAIANIHISQSLDNRAGTIASQGQIALTAEQLLNAALPATAFGGRITSRGGLSIHTTQNINNGSGLIATNEALQIESAELDNQAGNIISAAQASVVATSVNNSAHGRIASDTQLSIQSSGLLNNQQGSLLSLGGMQLQTGAATLDNRGGLIQSGGSIAFTGAQLDNRNTLDPAALNPLGIQAQNISLETSKLDNSLGHIHAQHQLGIFSSGEVRNNSGQASAGQSLLIHDTAVSRQLSIHNSGGALLAGQSLSLQAKQLIGSEQITSLQDLSIDLSGSFTHASTGTLSAAHNASLTVAGNWVNQGKIEAGNSLSVSATNIQNSATGSINATTIQLQAQQNITNRGLIDGVDTQITAANVLNLGTGRIYGDTLGIHATGSIRNLAESGKAGVIAARQRMDLGAATLVNQDGALIYSAGDLHIGGSLDGNRHATGQMATLSNAGAQIDVAGNMQVQVGELRNTNTHFLTAEVQVGSPQQIVSLLHGGQEYGAGQYGTNFGPLNQYADAAYWIVLLPSGQYPFDQFPATVASWAGDGYGVDQPTSGYPSSSGFYLIERGGGAYFDESGGSPGFSGYPWNHMIWAKLGVTAPPAPPPPYLGPDCGIDFGLCSGDQWAQYNQAHALLAQWSLAYTAQHTLLDAQISAFNASVTARLLRDWTVLDYTRTISQDTVISSTPGKISVGGHLIVNASGTALNDRSQIVVGGNATFNAAQLQNLAATGTKTISDNGSSAYSYYVEDCDLCNDDREYIFSPYSVIQQSQFELPSVIFKTQTQPTGSGTSLASNVSVQVAASVGIANAISGSAGQVNHDQPASTPGLIQTTAPNTQLPSSSLFGVSSNPTSGYLIETDPRFANYRQWLSSDYMLSALGLDPATTQKRLGDGFYEQRLIREQVAALTGHRFLGDYSSDEQQYQALMNSAVTQMSALQLRPGVALTEAQMARLTSDIVWLIEREVTLADGRVTRALVPQVYVRTRAGDLDGSGNLLSARNINLQVSGDIVNSGTIAGRSLALINAQNVLNQGGTLRGQQLGVQATQDIINTGGSFIAQERMILNAGRDLTLATTTQSTQSQAGPNSFSRTTIDRIAGLYVTGLNGKPGILVANAGRDLSVQAALISNASGASTDNAPNLTQLSAGRDLHLTTVTTGRSDQALWNANHSLVSSQSQEVGSQISSTGDIRVTAGQNINARAANVQAGGQLAAQAGQDIRIEAGEASSSYQEAHRVKHSGFLSSKTVTTRKSEEQTHAIESSFGGQSVILDAGRDLTVKGSSVIGDHDVILLADRDILITTAVNTQETEDFRSVKKSGIMGSGGFGVFIGSKQQSTDQKQQSTTHTGSTIGSIGGNVTILAGNRAAVQGSSILTPAGDINLLGQSVQITDVHNTHSQQTETKFKQSGLSVSVGGALVGAAETIASTAKAIQQTKDARSQALGAATIALAASNAADAVKAGQAVKDANAADKMGGISLNVSLGTSRSQSNSNSTSSTSQGSTLAAGGNLTIAATGAGKDSNLLIQGSQLRADNNISLFADNHINLIAGVNTSQSNSTSSSSSASIGASISLGAQTGVSLNASASKSRGSSDGSDVYYTNTQVTAGNTLIIASGGDTNLMGANAHGNTVIADIRGNLNIQSLQDSSSYQSNVHSSGGGFSIPIVGAGAPSVSVNAGKTNITSNFQSVNQQSGIAAGDGGFDIVVRGNTNLVGAVITSTPKAAEQNKNSLITGSLTTQDLHNSAHYQASSTSLGASYSGVQKDANGNPVLGQDGKPVQSGYNGFNASPPVALNANGNANSQTASGITGNAQAAAVIITNEQAQISATGKDAATTVASINTSVTTGVDTTNALKPIFNEKEIKAGFAIVGAFSKELGTFVENRAKEADALKEEKNRALRAGDEQRVREIDTRLGELQNWSSNGSYRIAATALLGAVSGNVTGSSGAIVQAAAVNVLQSLAVQEVGRIADQLDSEAARTALQGIVGCMGAAAQGASCSAGALGASAGTVINALMGDSSHLTASQKEARRNLVTTIVAALASQGGSVSTAVTAAAIETENNALSLRGSARLMNTLRKCEGSNAACDIPALKLEMARDSAKQNERMTQACAGASADLAQCMAIANNAQQSAMNLYNASIYADTPEKQALLLELAQQQVRDMQTVEAMVQANAANSTFKDAVLAVVVGSIEASTMAGVRAKKNADRPKAQQLGGSTNKPQGTDSNGFADSANGKRLHSELSALSKIKPDTSKDAELKAKTDQSVIANNKFDMDHVLQGEINSSGKATGYHAEFAAEGGARIKPGAQVQQNPNGTYEAPVQIFDASKGQWVDKVKKNGDPQPSTFFNPSWSQAKIEYEVSEAYKTKTPNPDGGHIGTTPSGLKIQFYWDQTNQRTTFYPKGQ